MIMYVSFSVASGKCGITQPPRHRLRIASHSLPPLQPVDQPLSPPIAFDFSAARTG
jgi:hypothetical protein